MSCDLNPRGLQVLPLSAHGMDLDLYLLSTPQSQTHSGLSFGVNSQKCEGDHVGVLNEQHMKAKTTSETMPRPASQAAPTQGVPKLFTPYSCVRAVPGLPIVAAPKASQDADEDDGADDEESHSLLGANVIAQQTQRPCQHLLSLAHVARWPLLIVCIICGLSAGPLSRWRQRGSSLPPHELTSQTVSTFSQPRQPLARLQHPPDSRTVCVDLWAIKFPLELNKWKRHSCLWKHKWGQCEEFREQCARTCGYCGGMESVGSLDGHAANEEDPEESITSRDASASGGEVGIAPGQGSLEAFSSSGLSEASRPASVRVTHPQFVSGARTQREALERLIGRRRKGAAQSAYRKVHYYGSDGDGDKEASSSKHHGNVDDSYEGPSRGMQLASTMVGVDNSSPALPSRATYVTGDAASVVSPGSECGIPIRQPAVATEFAMAAVQAKSFEASSRRYTSVTWAFSALARSRLQ